ncbi:MAG TPA: DUF3048 domain-containing protein [Chloroflexota bacterium]|nr:DUF3048 domain-containing protein [Chloroflexota bacterium]
MSRRSVALLAAAVAVLLVVVAVVVARHGSNSTPTPKPSPTVVAVASPCPTATASSTASTVPTDTPTPRASATPTCAAPCPTPTVSTPTPKPSATARPTPCPTATPLPERLKQFQQALVIPHPAFVPGPLTGQRVSWAVAHRRPMAIIVENYDPDSRPQTGLNYASLVFETVAEDGITRFMAVYLENQAPLVGPVRSARVYYDAWANGMHDIFVHAGGNDDALAELFVLHNIQDLNEVAFEDANYIAHVPFFIRSTDRVAPHNLYTIPAQVLLYLRSQHKQLSGNFPDSLPHQNPAAPFHRPHGGVLDLNFSGPGYEVEYQYDHATNRYLRFMGGVPHVDAVTGHQLAPSNVVVLAASIASDPKAGVSNPGAVYVQDTGVNKAYYFRDGKEFKGTWRKTRGSSPLELLDSHGRPFRLVPGQTWIEVLPSTGGMTWTPGH